MLRWLPVFCQQTQQARLHPNRWLIIDEVGKLELKGRGLAPVAMEKMKADITVDESGKITTPLSVAQLSYILRVLIETGTLKTDNLSNLFRFASEHISTTRKEEISFDSIRNKFYKPSASTKESVLDLFVKQVSYIRKDIS